MFVRSLSWQVFVLHDFTLHCSCLPWGFGSILQGNLLKQFLRNMGPCIAHLFFVNLYIHRTSISYIFVTWQFQIYMRRRPSCWVDLNCWVVGVYDGLCPVQSSRTFSWLWATFFMKNYHTDKYHWLQSCTTQFNCFFCLIISYLHYIFIYKLATKKIMCSFWHKISRPMCRSIDKCKYAIVLKSIVSPLYIDTTFSEINGILIEIVLRHNQQMHSLLSGRSA